MSDFWNERYRVEEYVYGTAPNDFLRDEAHRIPPGRVLCLADGEGRNGVFLAERGHAVTSVDLSIEGLRKAERLARERGVALETVHADLATYDPPEDAFAGVVSIFAHTPPPVRRRIHALLPRVLRVGGCLVLEAYRPEQVALGTGGPPDPALLPSLADLRAELAALDLVVAREVNRDVYEGRFHGGPSAVVQVVAYRRA